jgi:hypothetical protein
MTLYHLHGDELHRAGRDGRSALTRVVGKLRATIAAICRSVALTLRERTRDGDDGGGPSPEDIPARYPQAPLILGDKWDF